MDIICTRCAEPWDLFHVLHDAEPGDFDRQGALIRSCPCCKAGLAEQLPEELVEDLKIVAEMAELFGEDIDGFACWCEDHWPLRLSR
jgi:hypothetical protein